MKKLIGRTEIEDALKRLDKLTHAPSYYCNFSKDIVILTAARYSPYSSCNI
jgi:hypothetical protein